MDKYLEDGDLSEAEIKSALRTRTINNEVVLCACGSAFKNKGVQAVLDAVIEFLPSPTEVEAIKGINDDKDETEGSVVKPMTMHHFLRSHLRLPPTLLLAH